MKQKNLVQNCYKKLKEKGIKNIFYILLLRIKNVKFYIYKMMKERYLQILIKKSCDGFIIKKVQGKNMFLDLNDLGISRELALTGMHEKNSSDFLKHEIKNGMSLVEIGANIGYYVFIEANIIGKTGSIFAFEPNPVNFKCLKLNVIINDLEEVVKLFPFAIGDKNCEENFYIADRGNLSSFIKRNDNLCRYDIQKTKMVKLDDVFMDKKIDYIRMDIEGFEANVIKGMHNILSSKESPYGMYIEIHSELLNKTGFTAKEFTENLIKYGYKIKKSFYRGRADISADSTADFFKHPLREKGYWETFFCK